MSTRVGFRLPDFGASVLEPAPLELSSARDDEHALVLSEVLSRLGVADERVWCAVLRVFGEDAGIGASRKA